MWLGPLKHAVGCCCPLVSRVGGWVDGWVGLVSSWMDGLVLVGLVSMGHHSETGAAGD